MRLDPRSVANLIIRTATHREISLTNLALQKILYFVHGRYLLETGDPLLQGNFEAWKFGPVNLAVYDALKHHGSRPITSFAEQRNMRTGEVTTVPLPQDTILRQKVVELAVPYLSLSAGRLVDLSHAKGTPWDRATTGLLGERIYGMRITNEAIQRFFRFHKLAVPVAPHVGEPNEESPPT